MNIGEHDPTVTHEMLYGALEKTQFGMKMFGSRPTAAVSGRIGEMYAQSVRRLAVQVRPLALSPSSV